MFTRHVAVLIVTINGEVYGICNGGGQLWSGFIHYSTAAKHGKWTDRHLMHLLRKIELIGYLVQAQTNFTTKFWIKPHLSKQPRIINNTSDWQSIMLLECKCHSVLRIALCLVNLKDIYVGSGLTEPVGHYKFVNKIHHPFPPLLLTISESRMLWKVTSQANATKKLIIFITVVMRRWILCCWYFRNFFKWKQWGLKTNNRAKEAGHAWYFTKKGPFHRNQQWQSMQTQPRQLMHLIVSMVHGTN